MQASALEYRFRYAIHLILFTLGFIAPWNYVLHVDHRGANPNTWGQLAAAIARTHIVGIQTAFNLLLILATLFALAGAILRTWGAAYLSASVVQDQGMHTGTGGIIAAGPYRHLRNPLYLGTICITLAMALLMPASGAVFAIVTITVFQFRLIFREEPFLTLKLGTPYTAYCSLVPRILPSLRPRVAASGDKPAWPQAFFGELAMWGVAGSFAIAGWQYNGYLLNQCVLVSVGVSIVARAFIPKPKPAAESTL
jgi:protein-S-isoprenylcysteine O-methyltransferase Ste14